MSLQYQHPGMAFAEPSLLMMPLSAQLVSGDGLYRMAWGGADVGIKR